MDHESWDILYIKWKIKDPERTEGERGEKEEREKEREEIKKNII